MHNYIVTFVMKFDSAGDHHTVLPPTTLNVADESPGLRLERTLDYLVSSII